jgi:hypothetical protein
MASASTGQFTHATATPDWTHGSFAGSVTWTDCNVGCNSYLVLIYDEPSVYTCHAEDWLEESDPNIHRVWSSGGQTSNKTIPFELNNVSLIPGIYGQRLCMIGVQSTTTEFGTHVGQQLLASTLFQVEVPAPAPEATPPPTPSETCQRLRQRARSLRKRMNAARQAGEQRRAKNLRRALRKTYRRQRASC